MDLSLVHDLDACHAFQLVLGSVSCLGEAAGYFLVADVFLLKQQVV